MPQLHLYLPEELAKQVRERAKARGIPVSRFLSEIVEREVACGWPEGYFDRVGGGWKGEPLERPPQQEVEHRETLP